MARAAQVATGCSRGEIGLVFLLEQRDVDEANDTVPIGEDASQRSFMSNYGLSDRELNRFVGH